MKFFRNNGLTKKQSLIGYALFLFLVFMSHVFLPLAGHSDIYPFSTWQLFDGLPCKDCYIDLQIFVQEKKMLLSDYRGSDDRHVFNYLAQQVGNSDCLDTNAKKELIEQLVAQGIVPLSIQRLNVFLSDYILLSPEEKLKVLTTVCKL